jgi:MFS family permease
VAAPDSPDPAPRRRRWRGHNPWWIPIWLGRAPAIAPSELRTLGLVVLGSFFEAYDLSLLTAAIPHIADDLRIDAAALGYYLGGVRFGGFLAFALLPLGDRFGRRRLFLLSLVGMSVGTLATAFAQTPVQFLAIQVGTRAFMLAAASVGIVMLVEELPAEHRGWGIGILGALAAFGHGLGALLYAFVGALPFGWRALYTVGAVPLLALPTFRRSLRETARFAAHHAHLAATRAGARRDRLGPLVRVARASPGRVLGVGGGGFLLALGTISVFAFSNYYLRDVRGWQPWQYSVLLLTAGGVGIVGNVVAGNLGDRFGRRRVGAAALLLYPVAAIAFYHGPGWTVPISFAAVVFTSSAADVIVRAFATELFPTSQRSSSMGWLVLLQTFGTVLGLWLVSGGMQSAAALSLARVISLLSLAVGLAALFVLLLPETGRRELESLSSE